MAWRRSSEINPYFGKNEGSDYKFGTRSVRNSKALIGELSLRRIHRVSHLPQTSARPMGGAHLTVGVSAQRITASLASHFTFNKVPLRLHLVKRRGPDAKVHIAGFRDVPVCLTSKGSATAKDSASFERIDGTLDCEDCQQWAKTFETNWLRAGEPPRPPRSP
jgi:hypothetical protein